jgi:phosphate transport system protein
MKYELIIMTSSLKPTRIHYQQTLEKLKKDVFEMGTAAKSAFFATLQALKGPDEEAAKKNITEYSKGYFVDTESKIEHECIVLIGTQAPVSIDLRLIESCFKMITDFKRIANTARRLNKIIIDLKHLKVDFPEIFENLQKTGEITLKMLTDTLTTFQSLLKTDLQVLTTLRSLDDEIDKLYVVLTGQIVDRISQPEIHKDKQILRLLLDLLLVARHMERAGDHVCSIAERVHYIITGKRIEIS